MVLLSANITSKPSRSQRNFARFRVMLKYARVCPPYISGRPFEVLARAGLPGRILNVSALYCI
jgi:hypothetical protein